ncbi:hypothetical protein FA13DRAFT_1094582 [Coprinellus micaceus]|uniref:Uncharacterized protein n=1 Tax=Coprinellus micaceus TaxID=71717 RepID=A0A4Y7TSU1_COPMI|nr:hypothetical protein FA13DRAFT_1094582 [Coprinellus micaceus]
MEMKSRRVRRSPFTLPSNTVVCRLLNPVLSSLRKRIPASAPSLLPTPNPVLHPRHPRGDRPPRYRNHELPASSSSTSPPTMPPLKRWVGLCALVGVWNQRLPRSRPLARIREPVTVGHKCTWMHAHRDGTLCGTVKGVSPGARRPSLFVPPIPDLPLFPDSKLCLPNANVRARALFVKPNRNPPKETPPAGGPGTCMASTRSSKSVWVKTRPRSVSTGRALMLSSCWLTRGSGTQTLRAGTMLGSNSSALGEGRGLDEHLGSRGLRAEGERGEEASRSITVARGWDER